MDEHNLNGIYPDKATVDENDVQNTPPMVHLTRSQYKELCNGVKYGNMGKDSFIGCQLRFCGEETRNKTEEFINSIDIYKEMGNMADNDAVLTFPLLLTGEACIWWQGVSAGVKTWHNAIKAFRSAYAPELKPHEIYMKLFSKPQEEDEPISEFLDRNRALIAQLPQNLYKENQEIDLIYGLLKLNLREKIMRSDITTFDWLLERANYFESIDDEKLEQDQKKKAESEKTNTIERGTIYR